MQQKRASRTRVNRQAMSAVHRHRSNTMHHSQGLSAELQRMAHLSRDGAGRQKVEATAETRDAEAVKRRARRAQLRIVLVASTLACRRRHHSTDASLLYQ